MTKIFQFNEKWYVVIDDLHLLFGSYDSKEDAEMGFLEFILSGGNETF